MRVRVRSSSAGEPAVSSGAIIATLVGRSGLVANSARREASAELPGLMEQYQQGATLTRLAAEAGCHPVTIRRRLLAAGVDLRSARSAPRPTPPWWQEQIAVGRSAADLASELGLATTTVYQRLCDAGIRLSALQPPFAEWLTVHVRPDGECLRWTGHHMSGSGYGQAWWKGRKVLAHRLAWEQLMGPIPDDCELTRAAGCQHADCVQVRHLQRLPPRQRIREKVVAGAFAHGERHWNVKLSENDARAILNSREPTHQIATRYSISMSTVRAIRGGRSWRHLQR